MRFSATVNGMITRPAFRAADRGTRGAAPALFPGSRAPSRADQPKRFPQPPCLLDGRAPLLAFRPFAKD